MLASGLCFRLGVGDVFGFFAKVLFQNIFCNVFVVICGVCRSRPVNFIPHWGPKAPDVSPMGSFTCLNIIHKCMRYRVRCCSVSAGGSARLPCSRYSLTLAAWRCCVDQP